MPGCQFGGITRGMLGNLRQKEPLLGAGGAQSPLSPAGAAAQLWLMLRPEVAEQVIWATGKFSPLLVRSLPHSTALPSHCLLGSGWLSSRWLAHWLPLRSGCLPAAHPLSYHRTALVRTVTLAPEVAKQGAVAQSLS